REHVEITVYNVLGQRVKTLCSEVKEPGRYSLTWDGLNDNSISTASGIYFYKMKTSSYLNIKKMMLIK
ncbi:MAG: FlgD immunoglobulin-like domain containing protein, partial [Candidatus Cloacimonas sp.]|nr:T9SS type A sorting domain-containing protein [Candidatus Cloacimonadota bacterium]